MKISAQAGRVFDRLLDIMAWLGCVLIMFQVISVSLEVVSRYFLGVSFSWVTSLNEWSLVFLTFLGVAWLHREGGHTADDSIIMFFPSWVKVMFRYIGWAIAIFTCVALTWFGTKVTIDNYNRNTYDFFKLKEVPVFYVYMIIPIGSFLWLIQIIRSIVSFIRDKHDTPQSNVEL